MHLIDIRPPRIQPVSSIYKIHTKVDVLRLDEVHPVISGNKWFKLHVYLENAHLRQKKILGTWGGAFSNHILATAAAASACGWKSIGIIRGEQASFLSGTLREAQQYGMKLFFISREEYREKIIPVIPEDNYDMNDIYWIPEGGYGPAGAKGAQQILHHVDKNNYDVIMAAVGTGTMLAGITAASVSHQRIVGIPVMKNNTALSHEINELVSPGQQQQITLLPDFHFGGYAKKTDQLISFMNEFYNNTGIPSDFVYTGKLFFALDQLIRHQYFSSGSRILVIHSGGLQGNRTLPNGTLIF